MGRQVQMQSAGDYFTDVLFFHRCFCGLTVHCMSGASHDGGGGGKPRHSLTQTHKDGVEHFLILPVHRDRVAISQQESSKILKNTVADTVERQQLIFQRC